MRERPILFSAPMVRAILAGTKTQTRRIVKGAPTGEAAYVLGLHAPTGVWGIHADVERSDGVWRGRCPYGQPGDRLWVRETFSGPRCMDAVVEGGFAAPPSKWGQSSRIWFWADGNPPGGDWTRPRPSIHMPRWASRITLEITGVRVERLQAISEDDAVAEGIRFTDFGRKCGHGGHGWRDVGDCQAPDASHPQRPGWHWADVSGPDQCLGSARFAFGNLWESINGPGSWDANPWVWVVEFRRVTP